MRFTLLLAMALATPVAGKGAQLALVGATVIPHADAEPIADAVVLIDGERIAAVDARERMRVPDGARIVEARGTWIFPGLIDAHIHFFQSGGLYTRPDVIDLRNVRPYEAEIAAIKRSIPATFARYLASGITGVVDVGGPRWNFGVRALARQASAMAPRVAVAGPLIATWVPSELAPGAVADPPMIEVATPDRARAAVREELTERPDLVKVWFIHRPGDDLARQAEIVHAAIDAAHAGGTRVVVHATQLEVARAAVAAGADILAHSVEDRAVDEAFIRLVRERGVVYTTTLGVHEGYEEVLGGRPELTDVERRLGDPAVIATFDDIGKAGSRFWRGTAHYPDAVMAANLRRMVHAGVTVAAGTDAGNIGTLHGPALHRELELMAASGLTAREVLRAATRGGAAVMGRSDDLGVIAPGRLADLVVLDADPLADVRHARRIRLVVRGGRTFTPAQMAQVWQGRTESAPFAG